MSGKKGRAFPHERGIAWGCTVLLAILMTVTLLSALAAQAVTSEGLHARAATDGSVLDRETAAIHAYIDEMETEYGINGEPLKEAVSRSALEAYNRDAAAWWTKLLTTGEADPVPRWDAGTLEEKANALPAAEGGGTDLQKVTSELTTVIDRTVFPLRETVLGKGLSVAKEKADFPGLINALRNLPLLGLAACLLAAGLIALLTGREIRLSLKYYGTALAGTGIILAATGILLAVLLPQLRLELASVSMAAGTGTLNHALLTETMIAAAVLLAAGYGLLYLFRNKRVKAL